MQGHALRAAINTPIQGSAADVATAAMLSIDACQELKELGWKMLLQVPPLLVTACYQHACPKDVHMGVPDACMMNAMCELDPYDAALGFEVVWNAINARWLAGVRVL